MAAMTRGTIQACACPHCKKPNNFKPLTSEWGEETAGIEEGAVFNCDYCGKRFQIARIQPVTMLWLRAVR